MIMVFQMIVIAAWNDVFQVIPDLLFAWTNDERFHMEQARILSVSVQ